MPSPNRPTVDVELETLIRARYPIIYVVSWEERRVEETLREISQRRGKKMFLWTVTQGMSGNAASKDPLAALDYIMGAPDQSVFVLKDFHPFIGDVAVTRRLRDLVYALKTSYKTLIILAPLLKLPPELEKEISVIDYQLPTLHDLDRLLEGIIQSVRSNPQIQTNLTAAQREQVLKAASGLTSNEAENVFAKSLVEKRTFDVDVILSEKEQIIRKSGILEYFPPTEAFADVGGMDILKRWMQRRTVSFSEEARKYGLPEPKGILLLGVQGCGKSLTAKAIASLWHLPLLRLDVGKVFAGIVGSSEENMRKAIATAESVAPCVTGDTRILLSDGSERTIESLYDGSDTSLEVMAMTDDWQVAPVRVHAVTRRAAPDLYSVRLQHSVLQATANHQHPVLRDGELYWVRTDELQATDYVAAPRAEYERVSLPPDKGAAVDACPVGARLRDVRQSIGMEAEEIGAVPAGLITLFESGKRHPERACLRLIVEEMQQWAQERDKDVTELTALAALVDGPIAWSKVVSVTAETPPEYVYDLVCAGPHNFIANGVVTHNCCLWIDELEKGFAGTQSSPFSDGGTTSRVFGSFITWLQEKQAACFVIATSNDVSQLPPELMRKGRFDEIFFVDLPSVAERREIFSIHLKKRKRDPKNYDLDLLAQKTVGFSGAEIEQVVVSSLYDSFGDNARELATEDLLRTIQESVPLSVTMREGIARLREWAETRARPASSEQAEETSELEELDTYRTPPERDPIDDRLDALERKLSTGLDPVQHMTQNRDAVMPPHLPVVEAEGTETPPT